ncbi:MAG: hypothetical protein M5U28_31870 [Sandaracinaceae bacterium]|nr:hypothetical protein [Sandaracinaceae bacterium]
MSGPIPFGNYELIERIAEGGMAEVWRARSRGVAGFEKAVVIKRVLPALLERPSFAELLVREAKIAARLSHPNIVQIFDLGEQEGGYFIAMELLRGARSRRGAELPRPRRRGAVLAPPCASGSARRWPRPSTTPTARRETTASRSTSCTATSRRRTSCSASRAR